MLPNTKLTNIHQTNPEEEDVKEEISLKGEDQLNEKPGGTLPSTPTSKKLEKEDDFEALAKRFADLKKR